MVSATHFKVLLKKNFLTLKRKWGFALFFVLLPIISMGIFTLIKFAISDGMRPEGHNFDSKDMSLNYYRALHDNQPVPLRLQQSNQKDRLVVQQPRIQPPKRLLPPPLLLPVRFPEQIRPHRHPIPP